MNDLIFVYGTLRVGCSSGAHQIYLAEATFVASAKVKGRLYKVSYYPALVLDENAGWVTGEIYQLHSAEQLAALDTYEECTYPALPKQEYQRQHVFASGELGGQFKVWIYSYQQLTQNLTLIASGDFLRPA